MRRQHGLQLQGSGQVGGEANLVLRVNQELRDGAWLVEALKEREAFGQGLIRIPVGPNSAMNSLPP